VCVCVCVCTLLTVGCAGAHTRTVRRPPAYYRHLIARELGTWGV
jgi:hypothetical protein